MIVRECFANYRTVPPFASPLSVIAYEGLTKQNIRGNGQAQPVTMPVTLITHSPNSDMISPPSCTRAHTLVRLKRHRDRNRPGERKDEREIHVLNWLAVTERG